MRRLNRIDDLQWLAETVRMEAEGESFTGKLAVAYVIVNRADSKNLSIPDVVLRDRQFSAWNHDSPTRLTIDTTSDEVYTDCYAAAAAAYFKLVPDPTKGANHYLNEKVVIQTAGKLPGWFDHSKVTLIEGHHTFLKL